MGVAAIRLNPVQKNLSYTYEWTTMISVPAWGSFILCACQEPPATVTMTQAQYYHPSRGWIPLTYTGSYAFRAGILLLGVNGDYIAERDGQITLANVTVSLTFDGSGYSPVHTTETYDFGNGWTATKQGRMVTIVGSSTITSADPNPVLGTLPSGWAPPALVIAPVYINKAYSGWAPYMRVTTAGAVQVFSQGYYAAAYGSISYATS